MGQHADRASVQRELCGEHDTTTVDSIRGGRNKTTVRLECGRSEAGFLNRPNACVEVQLKGALADARGQI